MCLILFAHQYHPKYKLIVAANRDEFYARETQPARFWEDNPRVLAGRDIEAGGTWLGVNTIGEVSMLTNFRDLQNIKTAAPSRGQLVSDFLVNNQQARDYLKQVADNGKNYNGFNLICGTQDELFYYGNYQDGIHKIEPGIHGLSNALINTPWPKVEKGKIKFQNAIENEEPLAEDLFSTLYDDIKAPIEKLPDTGVGIEKEHMLSPMFIKSENYGSRCSTVLLVDKNDVMTFVERTYNTSDYSYFDKNYQLKIQ